MEFEKETGLVQLSGRDQHACKLPSRPGPGEELSCGVEFQCKGRFLHDRLEWVILHRHEYKKRTLIRL